MWVTGGAQWRGESADPAQVQGTTAAPQEIMPSSGSLSARDATQTRAGGRSMSGVRLRATQDRREGHTLFPRTLPLRAATPVARSRRHLKGTVAREASGVLRYATLRARRSLLPLAGARAMLEKPSGTPAAANLTAVRPSPLPTPSRVRPTEGPLAQPDSARSSEAL